MVGFFLFLVKEFKEGIEADVLRKLALIKKETMGNFVNESRKNKDQTRKIMIVYG